jgi:hypothetical protein
MLTLEEVNSREQTCRRCRGRFRLALPADWHTAERLARLLAENHPLQFIAELRKLTRCTLEDAKGTMQHFAIQTGVCHRCGGLLESDEALVDCPRCRSLNLQVHSAKDPR